MYLRDLESIMVENCCLLILPFTANGCNPAQFTCSTMLWSSLSELPPIWSACCSIRFTHMILLPLSTLPHLLASWHFSVAYTSERTSRKLNINGISPSLFNRGSGGFVKYQNHIWYTDSVIFSLLWLPSGLLQSKALLLVIPFFQCNCKI